MIKRLIGSGFLAAALAAGLVAQTAAPAGASGVAVAAITGTVDTTVTPVQFGNVALAGVFTAGTSVCAAQVGVSNLTILYSVESPALPVINQGSGLLYNLGHFATGGTFASITGVACTVTSGTIGDGALRAATNPLPGPVCTAVSALPNSDPASGACGGISFISVGTVALAELAVGYTVNAVNGSASSGTEQTVAVVDAIPGGCVNNISIDCALVVGAAAVLPV